MEEILNNIYNYIIEIINSSDIYGPLFAAFLISVESILPILPLFVFITIIFVSYGYVLGFIIAYLCTCIGCILSFFLCRTFLKNFFSKKIRKIKNFDLLMKIVDRLSLSKLVLLLAIPFTPAFVINLASGLSNMSFKKYFIAILISKISLVIFWGFIGTSLLASLQNPKIIIVVILLVSIACLFSKIVANKLNIK